MHDEIMGWPKMPCKCGRAARVHPETGKPQAHKLGKAHAGFSGMSKTKRRKTWCPEVVS